MAQSSKSNVAELNSDVSKQMAVLRKDIADLTAVVAEYGKAQTALVKDTVVETGVETAKSVKDQAERAYTDSEDLVRKNPVAAVGVAAAVGFVVGMFMSRR